MSPRPELYILLIVAKEFPHSLRLSLAMKKGRLLCIMIRAEGTDYTVVRYSALHIYRRLVAAPDAPLPRMLQDHLCRISSSPLSLMPTIPKGT